MFSFRLGRWVAQMKQERQTAGFGPCFHSPGQPIFEFSSFLSHSHFVVDIIRVWVYVHQAFGSQHDRPPGVVLELSGFLAPRSNIFSFSRRARCGSTMTTSSW